MDRKRVGLLCALPLIAVSGHAAPQYASIEIGEGMFLTPALDVELRYDDNIFQTERNEKSSMVTTVSPALELEARQEHGRVALSYGGAYGFYSNSSDDNFDNHTVRLDLGLRGARTDFDAYGAFNKVYEPRGTGVTDGLGDFFLDAFDEPVEYDEWQWGAAVHFGTRGTRSRLRLAYDGFEREYQNFRAFTVARDRTQHRYTATLGYALTGKTSAVLNVGRTDIDYDFTPTTQASLDSTEYRVTAGLEWEATAKTTGRVGLGWKWKDFDDAARGDQDSLTWELGVTWSPRTYSVFDFYTRNEFIETDNVGSAKDVSIVGVDWVHAWSDRLRTNTGLRYSRENYKNFVREDDFYRFSFSFDYDFQRWLTAAVGVRISSRDSNVASADYDRNVVFLRAQVGL